MASWSWFRAVILPEAWVWAIAELILSIFKLLEESWAKMKVLERVWYEQFFLAMFIHSKVGNDR